LKANIRRHSPVSANRPARIVLMRDEVRQLLASSRARSSVAIGSVSISPTEAGWVALPDALARTYRHCSGTGTSAGR
jgi:hypothetical protein